MKKYSEVEELKGFIERYKEENSQLKKQNEILDFIRDKQFQMMLSDMQELEVRFNKTKMRIEALGYDFNEETKIWTKRVWN